ncbi:hypothetical protein N7470_009332 [Penicillium chermesinum]|nr:hypothetical protein N7470_009332 [Penicillium chermesinum]
MDQQIPSQASNISHSTFAGITWTFAALTTASLCFRLYVQVTTFRRLYIDDFLVLLAWAIIFATTIIWEVVSRPLYDHELTSLGKEKLTENFLHRYETFTRFVGPFEILFYSGLWAVKLSFLAFFYRLCLQVKSMRIWWIFVLCFTISVYIISIGDIQYSCSFGSIEEMFLLDNVHYQNRTFWANAAGDVISDIMILSIPILTLYNAQISLHKKVILLGMYSVTIIIMAIAIVRVATTLDDQINIAWLCFWSFIEVYAAIIVSCVASGRQLFVTRAQSLRGRNIPGNPSGSSLRTPIRLHLPSQRNFSADIDSTNSEAMMLPSLSPYSIIHRREFEVTSSVTLPRTQAEAKIFNPV